VRSNQYLIDKFYFTGGTVLSEYYLKHRYSEDLDFFTEKQLEPDALFSIITKLAVYLDAKVEPRLIENRMYICDYIFINNDHLKVDFCHYPHPRLKEPKKDENLMIDSLFDIAVNKLATVGQRTTIKDFVDLYYLWKKFGFWDLTYGVEKKFHIKFDPFLVSSDLLAINTIEDMPRMIKPLKLEILKKFYRQKAQELARKSVE